MAFSWGFKKQLSFFGIFAFVVLLIVGVGVYFFWPDPTCYDGRQNQSEEAVDCGGPNCLPCQSQIKDLTTLWTRSLKISDGTYDFAAMVENSNSFLKASRFNYLIKFYDSNNILIAIKESTSYAEPGEKFVIFEPSISTQNRIPVRADLEIDKKTLNWNKIESKPLQIDILKTSKLLGAGELPPPRLEADIKNQSKATYRNIEATAVLWGGELVLGVSRTFIESMDIDETKTIVFTWPTPIEGVDRVEIFFRQKP
ncbi:hypothetical protein A2924_01100 [Candidatus Giovannonibacteria bacterium RIFCSPLOWO2_01_FULL_44_16]|nr:MAG: hypothetical protein A2924_01100 [Candidatus Giovannonibacteria bacterium RIFCSPLOWO2_01_FULL_44_16]